MFEEIIDIDIPLYKIYGVDAKKYSNISIMDFDVPIRIKNCFARSGIKSLEDVLLMSKVDIGNVKFFGAGCFKDLGVYLDNTIGKEDFLLEETIPSMELRSEVSDAILSGTVESLTDKFLTRREKLFLSKFNALCDLIGRDETIHFASNHEYVSRKSSLY